MAEKRATHQRARDAAQERMLQTARSARERGREIRCAALDMPWARCAPARLARETILSGFFGPVMAWYVNRKTEGREVFAGIRPPVIFVANHSSHMDTPAILRALPRAWRQRTAVAAAADYFYRKRWLAAAVSLMFSTVPISRRGGGMEHGAAVLAAAHGVAIMPIHVSGTREAMPPGRSWPKRLRAGMIFHRYPISVRFGPPIRPLDGEHRNETMARVQAWFDAQERGGPAASRSAAPSSADA